MFGRSAIIAFAFSFAVISCQDDTNLKGSSGVTVEEPVMNGIEVRGGKPAIAVDESTTYSAVALYSDGSEKEVTEDASWSTEDNVADMEGPTATGRVAGETQVAATYKDKSGSKALKVVESDDAVPNPPPEDTPTPDGPPRLVGPASFTNTKLASPSELGVVELLFKIDNVRADDKEPTVTFSLKSVDFSNPRQLSVKRTKTSEDPELYQAVITFTFDYKAVPEVTRYEGQVFELEMIQDDGKSFKKRLTYNVVQNPPGGEGNPPTKTLQGTAGHPEAVGP